jgi:DnaJ-class molecular chaperone
MSLAEISEYYKVLGFKETEKLYSKDEVHKQYRRMALILHPDKNTSDPNADQKFHALKVAYEHLLEREDQIEAEFVQEQQREKERIFKQAEIARATEELLQDEERMKKSQQNTAEIQKIRKRNADLLHVFQQRKQKEELAVKKKAGNLPDHFKNLDEAWDFVWRLKPEENEVIEDVAKMKSAKLIE